MKRLCWYLLTEIFHQRSKFFGPAICWWILLSLDHAKETGTRGLTTKCGVVMKGGIVLVIIQLSTSMVGTELSTSNFISTSTIWTLFRNNKFILYEMLQQKSFKKEFTLWFFIFFHSLNMAKFKAFQWKISSSINLVFLKSEIWTWISCMVSSCK